MRQIVLRVKERNKKDDERERDSRDKTEMRKI